MVQKGGEGKTGAPAGMGLGEGWPMDAAGRYEAGWCMGSERRTGLPVLAWTAGAGTKVTAYLKGNEGVADAAGAAAGGGEGFGGSALRRCCLLWRLPAANGSALCAWIGLGAGLVTRSGCRFTRACVRARASALKRRSRASWPPPLQPSAAGSPAGHPCWTPGELRACTAFPVTHRCTHL